MTLDLAYFYDASQRYILLHVKHLSVKKKIKKHVIYLETNGWLCWNQLSCSVLIHLSEKD